MDTVRQIFLLSVAGYLDAMASGRGRVAAIQMGFDPRGQEATIEKAFNFIDGAVAEGAGLIVLPEVFNLRYDSFVGEYNARTYELAETIPGPTTAKISTKAKEHGVYIVAPIFEKAIPGEYYDTAALIGPDGELLGSYRKTHIPGFGKWLERFYFKPGSEYPTFETGVGRLGMLICWDRHFPENWRKLTLLGAEIVVVPAAIPRWHVATVEYVTRTRALENGIFAVMACRPGREDSAKDSIEYTGSSMIVSPRGEILARAGMDEECIVTAEVDIRSIEAARQENTFLRDLRSELFVK
jgi:beta-ureidopropionase